jgi:hypothetical protein
MFSGYFYKSQIRRYGSRYRCLVAKHLLLLPSHATSAAATLLAAASATTTATATATTTAATVFMLFMTTAAATAAMSTAVSTTMLVLLGLLIPLEITIVATLLASATASTSTATATATTTATAATVATKEVLLLPIELSRVNQVRSLGLLVGVPNKHVLVSARKVALIFIGLESRLSMQGRALMEIGSGHREWEGSRARSGATSGSLLMLLLHLHVRKLLEHSEHVGISGHGHATRSTDTRRQERHGHLHLTS